MGIFSALITVLGFLVLTTESADYTNLAFKGCANQQFQDPSGVSTQNLKNLLASLVSQSSTQTYFTTTSGEGQTAISGLFQCRGDLTSQQCYTCVTKAQSMTSKLCEGAIAARIQLEGCYLRYQVSGFKDESGSALLYHVCESSGVGTANGFDGWRETAFGMVESGVKSGGGFYTGSYQSVFVLGQCEADLSSGDCGDCIKSSVGSVKSLCSEAVSARVYLNKCFLSYSFYPNGVPSISSAPSGTKAHTQRTVAIAVGGVAALGFLIALLLCVKSLTNKRRGKHEDW